jgi:predicted O-methyltransferase YrrM
MNKRNSGGNKSHLRNQSAIVMDVLAQMFFSENMHVLEIGTWYGLGSTQVWLRHLKPNSTLTLLDSWRAYDNLEPTDEEHFNIMSAEMPKAIRQTHQMVIDFEKQADQGNIDINIVRAKSDHFLPLMKENSFDFIYLDGSHKYDDVIKDIRNSKKLIKKDIGIICGDDLELPPAPELIEIAKENKKLNRIKTEFGSFHPGVFLAILEEFEAVNTLQGFWWIACYRGEFVKELFSPAIHKNNRFSISKNF